MTHAPYLREKAREMRVSKRLTIDELAERLALSRSTIYYWVRDLRIDASDSSRARRTQAQKRGTRAMQRKYAARRELAYREGAACFEELAQDPTFRDFVCLYIAEGYKRDRNCVAVGNSDPAVVALCHRWMSRFSEKRIGLAIQYHADQDVEELRRFWGERLDVVPASITLQRKSNSNQLSGRTWRCRYGVLTVRVGDTMLRARLGAWMDCLKASWG